jgi:hypothetical protein
MIGNWARDHVCYLAAKNLCTFFPCPEFCGRLTLKFLKFGRNFKTVQHSGVAWLLLAALSQLYSENQEQKDLKNFQLSQKSQ